MVLASLASVRKYYSSTATLAVDGADFSIEAGEVHALVGENGAGKSTLARMLCGFETPDSGTIEVRGKPVRFYSHRDAERAGIGFVPQYSMLAAGLSAAENVAMGHEPARLGIFSDKRRAAYEFSMLADRYGFDVDPDAAISSLSAAARREVEILRAMARGGDVLVLDEPTSILGEHETKALFSLIGRLKAAGAGIVYISHRARELLDLADRISVMRYGKVEKTIRADEIDECGLADLIVTRGSCSTGPVNGGTPGAIAISIRGVSLAGRGEDSLDAVDLAVRSGEIVSVVALGGNGLDSLEEVAAGLVRPDVGDVMVLGKAIGDWKPQELRTRVMAYLPTDREGRGLCPRASVGSNVIARKLFRYTFAEFAIGDAPRTDAGAMLGKFGVGNWRRRRVDSMSGGNRQRVVAARELEGFSPLVIAANPAQGLDPAARAALFGRLSELRDQGAAILLLTSDPEDASDLADKVFALYRGRLRQLDSKSGDPSGLAAAITGAAS
ncbi:MAG: heme ABC transporter ATP-binding protein [Spirochaetae bacterium HGW-Spirochaetae-7]|jgi:simple sugar transport system ATP-binding protein|nr:MAG: heme ABC transporter ATP-binding protein [Spirochaetae bacterium HGW-Spirochaetae-7]